MGKDEFFEQYGDVLQNIEFAIIQVFRAQPELTDYNVEKALSGLIRVYQAQVLERAAPNLRLRDIEQAVFDAVQHMCEWRLGHSDLALPDPTTDDSTDENAVIAVREPVDDMPDIEPLTTQEIVACLKRIRKSVNFWTKSGGRQGYLEYVEQFL